METFSALLALCAGHRWIRQSCGVLMFSLICTRINGRVNNLNTGDLRRHRVHFDVTVMGWLMANRRLKRQIRQGYLNLHRSAWDKFYGFLFHCSRRITWRWRHNGHVWVSNHQPHDWLLNLSCMQRSKKTSKVRVTGLCERWIPHTKASNAENVSIMCRKKSCWHISIWSYCMEWH